MSFLPLKHRSGDLTISTPTIHVPAAITSSWDHLSTSSWSLHGHTCSPEFEAGNVTLPKSKSDHNTLLFKASNEFSIYLRINSKILQGLLWPGCCLLLCPQLLLLIPFPSIFRHFFSTKYRFMHQFLQETSLLSAECFSPFFVARRTLSFLTVLTHFTFSRVTYLSVLFPIIHKFHEYRKYELFIFVYSRGLSPRVATQ